MVYAEHLREAGNSFMKEVRVQTCGWTVIIIYNVFFSDYCYVQGDLNYDPGSGRGRSQPNNGGGEFISVHLRRADYIQARPGIY